ncbi:MAG: TIGR04283 family arsenosugar biosynthesis glycosyltransferase [Thermomicrobiales bacterium]
MTLSVVIPALEATATLADTLLSLTEANEVVVVDGGSLDDTVAVAIRHGARVINAPKGRGCQLATGASLARGEWLLFLHADTRLAPHWKTAVDMFTADVRNKERAATFGLKLDDDSHQARRLERMVAWRARWLGLPYGDQGLLLHREFYAALGGYKAWPVMEDVDLVRRIGRSRLVTLPIAAYTDASRWKRDGWTARSLRNVFCLTLYFLHVPPRLIARIYGYQC